MSSDFEFYGSARKNIVSQVALHWSRKLAGRGAVVTKETDGFGIWLITVVNGRKGAVRVAGSKTEAEARRKANNEWKCMGW